MERVTGAEARELRTLMGWSLTETCGRCRSLMDKCQLSRFELGRGYLKEEQRATLDRVLRTAVAQRARTMERVVAGWAAQAAVRASATA